MRVLVAGGAGLIGSHIVEALLEAGHFVCVIDNYKTGRRDNLSEHPHLNMIEGDVSNTTLVNTVFDQFRPHTVVHAAAGYSDPNDWVYDIQTNIMGMANLVKAAQAHHISRFVYFQTSLCYGNKPLEQPITLAHPIMPDPSSYAISKTAGEQYLDMSELDYVSFRLANIIGPRNLSGAVPTFYQRLTQGKPCFVMDSRRDFLFVKDMVPLILQALEGVGRRGAYHIASGRDYSILQLYQSVCSALNLSSEGVEIRERLADDAPTIYLDPTQTESDFNWKATTPLEESVKAAVSWYQTHGVSQAYTHLKVGILNEENAS